MHKIKVYLHRLFFYSSRQLFRRYRSYLSIFSDIRGSVISCHDFFGDNRIMVYSGYSIF